MSGRTEVLRAALANRRVCLLELAFSGFNVSECGVWIAVLVYAYQRGGTTVTALVAFSQLVPAAIAAPVLARSADQHDPVRALRRGYWCQAATLGSTWLLAYLAAPDLSVYAGAVLAASAVTATRPAQAALVPRLARSSDELTAINVLSGWVESVSILAGPALAAVLVGLDGPEGAIGLFALIMVGSAGLTASLDCPCVEGEQSVDHEPDSRGAGAGGSRRRASIAPIVAVLGAAYLVIGVLDVLLVALAIDVLRLGPSGPGYLTAAFGAGGVLGSFAAVSLIGRRSLVSPLLAAGLAWAGLLIALGGWMTAPGAFLMLPAAGLARSMLDVSGRTMLLRRAPPGQRARVFGLLEAVAMMALAAGSLSVPVLMWAGGARVSLIATGTLLSVIALAAGVRLARVDEA